jgi:hypothetical protein
VVQGVRASNRLIRALTGLALVLAVSGCATASPSATAGGGASEPASAPSSTAPSESTAATPWPHCLAEDRGNCLGPLPAGTYTTVQFQPPITYTVPAGGWSNFEDHLGNFLLVPPGFDLAGVDTGGSDYIGIYASVLAANVDCTESEQPNVGRTAAALAAEFAQRPGLTTTTPTPVSVGGLQGLVLDIRLADGWTQTCFYSGGSPVVPLIRGVRPSDLDSPIGPAFIMRLYLLDRSGSTLAIELGDLSGGTHLDAYSAIVDELLFGS